MRLCFSNVTAFENGERVVIKVEWWRSRFKSDSIMPNSNDFLSFWGGFVSVFFFFSSYKKHQGAFVLLARWFCCFCYYCVLVLAGIFFSFTFPREKISKQCVDVNVLHEICVYIEW